MNSNGDGDLRRLVAAAQQPADQHIYLQLVGPDGAQVNVPWEVALVRVLGEMNGALQRLAAAAEARQT